MRLCSICEREITKHNRFTESKTYKNHSTRRDRQLWTIVNITGAIEGLTHKDSIKPLCIKCAIEILENTIMKLKQR